MLVGKCWFSSDASCSYNDNEPARTFCISFIFLSFDLWLTDRVAQISGLVLLILKQWQLAGVFALLSFLLRFPSFNVRSQYIFEAQAVKEKLSGPNTCSFVYFWLISCQYHWSSSWHSSTNDWVWCSLSSHLSWFWYRFRSFPSNHMHEECNYSYSFSWSFFENQAVLLAITSTSGCCNNFFGWVSLRTFRPLVDLTPSGVLKSIELVLFYVYMIRFVAVEVMKLKVVSATFLLVLNLNDSTCQIRKNIFYFISKALCSRENQILELYLLKFHDFIKCLSIKQEIHFIK